jgi:hypothetical protein
VPRRQHPELLAKTALADRGAERLFRPKLEL